MADNSLMTMLSGERKTKKYELAEGKSIVLQTLTAQEKTEVERIVFSLMPNCAFHQEISTSRVYILARSLVSINGIPCQNLDDVAKILSNHKKELGYTPLNAITEVLNSVDDESLNLLYSLQLNLETEDREEKDKMRNFSLNQKEDTSGSLPKDSVLKK